MDETLTALPSNIAHVNESSYLFKTHEDPKYFYVAIASLVVFFLISIITTVLLCVTLKNEPILWEADGDAEKPAERISEPTDDLQATSDPPAFEDEENI